MIPAMRLLFDEKYFEESGIIFWIFQNGLTEYTNERIHRAKTKLIQQHKIIKPDKPSKSEKSSEKKS